MWRADHGRTTIDRARHFDLVVEPGEFAADLDAGPTAGRAAVEAVRVPPVILLGTDELLHREAARAELGLDPDRTAVLVQLGSRNNFDYAGIDEVVVEELGSRPDVELVFVDWLIGDQAADHLPPHVRRLRTFPVARLLAAFDLAVSAAGYNSFHELLLCGVPTLFVPNEHPMMDDQGGRARWAERRGLALQAAADDPFALGRKLGELLEPERWLELQAAMARLPPADGAGEAAAAVAEMAYTLRADRPEA
jgi:UDP:flavonoid glycosyltransferase YjiC (YdhE family)